MDVHLEEKEASLLLRILRNRLTDLRHEVRHDKDSESREYLKHKERILNRIIAKFSEIDDKAHKQGFIIPEE